MCVLFILFVTFDWMMIMETDTISLHYPSLLVVHLLLKSLSIEEKGSCLCICCRHFTSVLFDSINREWHQHFIAPVVLLRIKFKVFIPIFHLEALAITYDCIYFMASIVIIIFDAASITLNAKMKSIK